MKKICVKYDDFVRIVEGFDFFCGPFPNFDNVPDDRLLRCEMHAVSTILELIDQDFRSTKTGVLGLCNALNNKIEEIIRCLEANPNSMVFEQSDNGVTVALAANKERAMIGYIVTAPSGLPDFHIKFYYSGTFSPFLAIVHEGIEYGHEAIIVTGFKKITYQQARDYWERYINHQNEYLADSSIKIITEEDVDGTFRTFERPEYFDISYANRQKYKLANELAKKISATSYHPKRLH
jgi:hypothetical protein